MTDDGLEDWDNPDLSPEERKAALIDANRDWNTAEDWWSEDIIDDFVTETAAKAGFTIDKKDISWSVGYCQSDGAEFTASVDVPLFLGACENYPPHPAIDIYLAKADQGDLSVSIRSHGHNSGHWADVEVAQDMMTLCGDPDPDEAPLHWAMADKLETMLDAELTVLEETVLETAKDLMRTLYTQLRDELDYQSSDEAVWESLLSADRVPEDLIQLLEQQEAHGASEWELAA